MLQLIPQPISVAYLDERGPFAQPRADRAPGEELPAVVRKYQGLSQIGRIRGSSKAIHAEAGELSRRTRQAGIPPQGDIINDALWHAALVAMFKCFGRSEARTRLDPAVIYTADQLTEFNFWKSMRDKNIVHDDNDASQAHILAVMRCRPHALPTQTTRPSTAPARHRRDSVSDTMATTQ